MLQDNDFEGSLNGTQSGYFGFFCDGMGLESLFLHGITWMDLGSTYLDGRHLQVHFPESNTLIPVKAAWQGRGSSQKK